MENRIDFRVWARYALFTDPIARMGGEKSTYHLPTYEALKGIAKSIYWKPTFIWYIDKVRVMKKIRTQSKSMKPLNFGGGNELAIYTYLADVEYQVQMHFEWNPHYPEMKKDRIDGKHFAVARRMLEKGGRRDVFLGTRECQGYVEPCTFWEGSGEYDGAGEIAYALMFHGFDYPDEIGEEKLYTRFWSPKMVDGVVDFIRPEQCSIRKFIREQRMNRPVSNGLEEGGLCDELDT